MMDLEAFALFPQFVLHIGMAATKPNWLEIFCAVTVAPCVVNGSTWHFPVVKLLAAFPASGDCIALDAEY